ncbi:MAG: condensation protein, partial [Methanocalculus sp.]|nr:condensation protein [Methanocalculus sp.]
YLPMPGKEGRALSLERFHFIPCICWPNGFLVTAYTFRGELTLITAYEEGPYSTETVERFLEYMDGYMA